MKLVYRMFYIRMYPYPVAHNHPSSRRPFWQCFAWQCASLTGSSSMRKMGINSLPVSLGTGSDAWGKMKWANCTSVLFILTGLMPFAVFIRIARYWKKESYKSRVFFYFHHRFSRIESIFLISFFFLKKIYKLIRII